MIQANNIGLQFGGRTLFNHADVTFTRGNCYGLIGANGAGKSTFLRILSGDLEPSAGEVFVTPGERISVLRQDHFAFDDCDVIRAVLLGNPKLCKIIDEKEILYAKEDFTEEDGMRISELEESFAEMDGWSAESDAEILLNGLGVTNKHHALQMRELPNDLKVKVLLAQALFGNPDILLMDEPTNHLDVEAIHWLEEFLQDLQSIVIVVSHDRHFLNQVCTHTVDIDFGKITMFMGNYDFWYSYTQIAQRQQRDQSKKAEQKIKELQEFIQRFSANASKSKQATSRKKLLESLKVEDLPVSTRRFPYIAFQPERPCGNELITVTELCKTIGGRLVLDHVSFTILPREKVAFVGTDAVAKTTLFKLLAGEIEPDEGTIKWGVTTTRSYFPSDNSVYFDGVEDSLIDWVRRHSNLIFESDVRGWLGRLLFGGDEGLKQAKVLSGGERVRCMLCKMMLSGANVLLLDEPTNHLDLESIASLNDGLTRFGESILFTSHDHQFVQTIADRIIDVTPGYFLDKKTTYDDYLAEQRELLTKGA
ncbi:MAG: ATP-binding cassette domain-containing protein [Oscillospiraceae bacterium]|jgi:ATPase subunit of ABC transporter with duplicated ATPase domains|nr:ATP-binding cassette domain-containing protein [Oscillospiraceae bacterium]